jgi:VIT1/CCC1 family predicted Fe2+/Mn2+ transporter
MPDLSKFSFGATSAIITSLALIVGLGTASNNKLSIIGALLVIAIADNIADSLGIHIYRESQGITLQSQIKFYTITNFIARLAITLIFILFIILLQMNYAIIFSVALGLIILSVMSYFIAINQKEDPFIEIFKHVGLAVIVLVMSLFVGQFIKTLFIG